MFKRKNIWFHCPSCGKKLVVGVQAGGYRADCPECGNTIPIPERSTTYPAWAKSLLINAAQVLVILVLLSTAGWWIRSTSGNSTTLANPVPADIPKSTEPIVATSTHELTEDDSTLRATAEINQQLLDDHMALQGKYNKMVQWMIENYRGKYPLPSRLISQLRLSPVTDDNAVHPDLVEMLRMTEKEKALIQDIFDYVRKNLSEAEIDRALITEKKEGSITFSIPTYSEVGSSLKEDLYLTLENTLGGARFDRMVDVTGEEMRERFHYFGEASRTLTFQVINPVNKDDHPPYVLIRDGWVIPEGNSVRLTKVTETAVSSMPEAYRDYQEFLPEEITRYTSP